MTHPTATIETLRALLATVDRDLIRLIGDRQRLVRAIGAAKDRETRDLRDFAQERRVLERARDAAQAYGVRPALAERILSLLIEASLAGQEEQRVRSRSGGAGRRALVIGGAGRMGSWFVRFLAAQGYEVTVADPAASPGAETLADWRDSPLDEDLILVAAPLGATRTILEQLATARPRGVVCDIGSVKSPLRAALEGLVRAGGRASSLHPLFGPDTELLAGRHVVLVDLGVAEANEAVRALFAPTMAEVVTMDLDAHDRTMAHVLGLSHALNIAFFTVLADSGNPREALTRLSSTTFDRQLAVAAPVAMENPRLYFEIQHLNEHGLAVLDALAGAVARIRDAVREGDEEAFVALMERGRAWMAD
jgi:chorismate mutase/prephenate dehydrogenase